MTDDLQQIQGKPPAHPACCGAPGDGTGPVRLGSGPRRLDLPWMDGVVTCAAGVIPRARTRLLRSDRLGALKVRWGIGRMDYRVEPGLYAVGDPGPDDEVFVSANYKLSFDRLRSQLGGIGDSGAWILVLDTRGINVWCAAGKGTFGTAEIVRRVREARLAEVVSHRRLIVPQLGAPGVGAHEVKEQSGFEVAYGPIRAEDLPAYLAAGRRATPAMRRKEFPLGERMALVPVEVVGGLRWLGLAVGVLAVLAGLGEGGYSLERAAARGPGTAALLVLGYLVGTVLVPALLPYLPGRAFSVKGAVAGLAPAAGLVAGTAVAVGPGGGWPAPLGGAGTGPLAGGMTGAAWILIITAVASFLGMNFTGSSTYTSLSGVVREMKIALPLQIAAATVGLGLWVAGRFA